MTLKKIRPHQLVPLDIFEGIEPVKIDVVYKNADHKDNIFGKIYHDQARLWVFHDLALITLKAARIVKKRYGLNLLVYDSLRTVDSQKVMQETPIVKAHPEWMIEPRMLAPPGAGGHPRAMAIDLTLINHKGELVDMGTPFDGMEKSSWRHYKGLSDDILKNRKILEDAMLEAARHFNLPLLPIPQEWWDFRFPPETYNQYAPLSDADLPPQMRMTTREGPDIEDLPPTAFENLKKDILQSLN